MAPSRIADSLRVPTAKVVPPSLPSLRIERPILMNRFDEALGRRLTTVIAGPGYGKSSALAAWVADANAAWYSLTADDRDVARLALGITEAIRLRAPGLPADLLSAPLGMAGPDAESDPNARAGAAVSILSQALHERLQRDVAIVLDDLHELPAASPAVRLVGDLIRQAPGFLHVVVASRDEPPLRVERLRGHGQVLEVTASDLAFDAAEVAALLGLAIGPSYASIADAVYELTGGWPAAVRMAIEALRREPPEAHVATLERLRRPGGSIFGYLAEEVIGREPPSVRRLISAVAPLRGFSPELCGALGVAEAHELLPALDRRGLFLEPDRTRAGWYALSPLVRDYALGVGTADGDPAELARAAARWLTEHDDPSEALGTLIGVGTPAAIAQLLEAHGQTILERGAVRDVITAAAGLDGAIRTPAIEQLEGQARQVIGDWQGALACYQRAAAATSAMPPALAWRMGVMHHLRGELAEAERVYAGADMTLGQDREQALLLSWQASAHWLRGDEEACRVAAERALALATSAADDQALAAAHTVQAMLGALRGDRRANDEHYLMALDHAQRAGDVLQLIRIRANRGSRLLEEAAYREALDELGTAIQLADVAGFAAFHALALTNRGDTLARLGRLEEAVSDLEAARDIYQRIGSRMIAYPLAKLGEVHRLRGDRALARAAFEESRQLGEESGDHQALVPALAGLARVLAAEQPQEAADMAERALAMAAGTWHVGAVLAAAWVAAAQGRTEEAARLAEEAAGTARSRRDLAGLAEALELQAAPLGEPGSPLLEEAGRIWQVVANPIGRGRVALRLALRRAESDAAAAAIANLESLGARGVPGEVVTGGGSRADVPPVELHLLGGFQLLRNGQAAPLSAWQSRKARDLLKVLATRGGHPAARDALMETLWPEEPPDALANRFSVALSTVRQVLDPERRFPSDWFVSADKSSVRLRLEHMPVDVDRFLALARAGLRPAGSPAGDVDLAGLAQAEAAYTGDLLEEDAYADWAAPLREEARSLYVAVARELAAHATRSGDHETAIRLLLRLLARDPYDERAHLALVSSMIAAGRHGAARQAYRTYCGRMDEIDVESAPYPAAASS